MGEVRLCTPWYWRLEPLARGGYVIALHCMRGHIDYAERCPSYEAARDAMRAWIADTFWPDYPPPMIADAARGRLILGSGYELPLAPASDPERPEG